MPAGSGVPGEKHHAAKLTREKVTRLRANVEGWNDHRWGREFGVTPTTVRLARLNVQWHDPEYTPAEEPMVKPGRPKGTTKQAREKESHPDE